MDEGDARATIARRLRTQGKACGELGSPLYADLLEQAARDVESGGATWAVLTGHEQDPGPSALALRLLGAVNRIVLRGEAPELAGVYASASDDAWPAFERILIERAGELRREVDKGVQTNEVGRAGALAPAFLFAARETGSRELRMLEVGASGGLNLRWDAFGYRHGERTWGDASSPVQLGDPYEDGTPPLDVEVTVVARAGCDPNPVDVTTDEGARTLLSFVWPDQHRRGDDLRAAIDVARRVPASVERSEAAPWVTRQLSTPAPGGLTIVYHSVVMQYLTEEGRAAFVAAVEEAGTRATPDAPLAWVRFEPTRRTFEVRVTTWPGGEERLVAESGAHGRPVRWLA